MGAKAATLSAGAAALALLSLVASSGGSAAQDRDWTLDAVDRIGRLAANPQCADAGAFGHIHVLGIAPGERLLTDTARQRLLTRLVSALTESFTARVTRADTFAFIATARAGFDRAAQEEIARLVDAASDADLTVLLRPRGRAGPQATVDLMLWTRKGRNAARAVACSVTAEVVVLAGNPPPLPASDDAQREEVAREEVVRDLPRTAALCGGAVRVRLSYTRAPWGTAPSGVRIDALDGAPVTLPWQASGSCRIRSAAILFLGDDPIGAVIRYD